MPLYVRTSDNVVLRFEDVNDLRAWVKAGKVDMEATYMTEDKLWKPIKELLAGVESEKQPEKPAVPPRVQSPPPKVQAPSQVEAEPAWVAKPRVILPVSDWDDDDDLDFDEEPGSKRGWFFLGLLIVIAGVAAAAYFLFGDKIPGLKKQIPKSQAVHQPVKTKAVPAKPNKKVVENQQVARHEQPGQAAPAQKTAPQSPKPSPAAAPAPTVATPQKPAPTPPPKQVASQPPEKPVKKPVPVKKALAPKPVPAKNAKKRPSRPRVVGGNSFDSHMSLGNRLLIRGDYVRAEGHFQFALNIRPRSVEALTKIGECEARKGHFKKAIGYFRNALTYNGEYSPAMINIARLYSKMGNRGQARAWYSKYLDVHPFGLHAQEAKAYLQSGK